MLLAVRLVKVDCLHQANCKFSYHLNAMERSCFFSTFHFDDEMRLGHKKYVAIEDRTFPLYGPSL